MVLYKPELVRQQHEEFVHAGSDVVVAFTVSDTHTPVRTYILTQTASTLTLTGLAEHFLKQSVESQTQFSLLYICSILYEFTNTALLITTI